MKDIKDIRKKIERDLRNIERERDEISKRNLESRNDSLEAEYHDKSLEAAFLSAVMVDYFSIER